LKFANYGFNRSHAVAYSMIAYQMAYLKVHFPAYFMAVSLSNVIGSERSTAAYIKEAKQLKIPVLPPSVNESRLAYQPEGGGIRFSLLPIKNIGQNLARQIVAERDKGPYLSFYDFVSRTSSFLSQRSVESLIDVGAMDEFGHNRATLHGNLGRIEDFSKYDMGLFATEFELTEFPEELPQDQLMEREKELLGFYLKSHPLSLLKEEIHGKGWYLPSDLWKLDKKMITCVGLIEKVRQIRDKNGQLMAFMEISDEEAKVTLTIFSKQYESHFRSWQGRVITVKGVVETRKNEKNIKLSEIITIT
jgi:DNA polymerase-3 subunit alpha